MIDIMEQVRAALQRHLKRSVRMMWRRQWVKENHPDGRPVKLARPLPPLRGTVRMGETVTNVASAQPFAVVPGTHAVRHDEGAGVYKTYSHDVIDDLPGHEVWRRVIEITGAPDTRNLRRLVRRRVFLVETRRQRDHHSSTVPSDIASATLKDNESEQ